MQLDEMGLYDIYGFDKIPFWQTTLFMYVSIAFALILFIVLTYLGYHFYTLKYSVPKTPYEHVIHDLALLKDQGYVSAVGAKQFYHGATTSLKRYLTDEWEYNCMAKTDQEVVNLLHGSSDIVLLVGDVTRIFLGAQTVKFASERVTDEYVLHDYQAMIDFVHTLNAVKNKDK